MERDQQFAAFVQAYPAARRQRGYMVETLFLHAVAAVSFEALMLALDQHKRSDQWQTPRLIPNMRTWLEEERYYQVLPTAARGLSVADEAQRWRSLSPQEQLRRLGVKR
jgi:uncharacterized ferritin-like protein (DUF455 family)